MRGRNTTTRAEIVPLGGGAYIVDTPGFSMLDLFDVRAEELSDGGISLGHGHSFWVHPRSLHFEIAGLDTLKSADGQFTLTLFIRTPAEELQP